MGGTWSSIYHPQQYFCSAVDRNLALLCVIIILLDPATSLVDKSPRAASTCQIGERALYDPGLIQKATQFFKRVMTPVAASFASVSTFHCGADRLHRCAEENPAVQS